MGEDVWIKELRIALPNDLDGLWRELDRLMSEPGDEPQSDERP